MCRENDLSSSSLSWSSISPLPRRPAPCLRVRPSASLLSGPLSFFLSYIYLPGSLGGLVNAPPPPPHPKDWRRVREQQEQREEDTLLITVRSEAVGEEGTASPAPFGRSTSHLISPWCQPRVQGSPCSPSAQAPSLARRGAHPRAPIQGKARSQLRLNWAL